MILRLMVTFLVGIPVFLPIVQSGPDMQPHRDIRIDHLSYSELDRVMKEIPLPEHVRARIIEGEKQRRAGKIEGDDGSGEIEAVGPWTALNCSQGQGVTMTWAGMGGIQSQWHDHLFIGSTWWTPPLICPPGSECAILSTIPAQTNRWWIAFRGWSSMSTPRYIAWSCFFTA